MSRFLLVLHEHDDGIQMTPEEYQTLVERYWQWTEQLRQVGYYLSGEALKDDRLVVRSRDGQAVVDGPFAETKETIGGFYIIEAPDLATAAHIAKGSPALSHGGSVEVREIVDWD